MMENMRISTSEGPMTANLSGKFLELQSNPDASGIVLPVIFEILAKWSFGVKDQMIILGLVEEQALHSWREHPDKVEMTHDRIERISYILGIFKSLETLLPDPQIADTWLSTPNDNSLFNGAPPKSRLLTCSISDLAAVRNFLSSQEDR